MERINLCNINNYDNAIIAEKIKKECMRQDITVKTMLQELNIGKDAIQQMYKYDKTPNYKTIARICDYLNISVDRLLDRQQQPAPMAEMPISGAIEVVAAAARTTPEALAAVLHLTDYE